MTKLAIAPPVIALLAATISPPAAEDLLGVSILLGGVRANSMVDERFSGGMVRQ
jgi:hypothetical protein